ncbi:MAG: hypothetical protein IJR26_07585 [Bacteroidales bacterium]|nr:hypothetical protein [Bacteroidales bacterium]
MPRQARTKSEFGIYHVMMRGVNRQNIFDDEEDMAVRLILDAGASVRQAVSHTGLTTKQIRKRYDI